MNDEEYAELLRRERIARDHGYTRNDYTCYRCLAEGKSEAGSTYLNWPVHFDREGKPLCHVHGEEGLTLDKSDHTPGVR